MEYNYSLTKEEIRNIRLQQIFESYGYSRYRMNKFEDYELYLNYKDYIPPENIIAFKDSNGGLLALKPDLTMSIVKNHKDSGDLDKVFYNEFIYRNGENGIVEIRQAGVEALGNIDDFTILEITLMALDSLKSLSDSYLLEVSHMGIIKGLVDGLSATQQRSLLEFLRNKNGHDMFEYCQKESIDETVRDNLMILIDMDGEPQKAISILENMKLNKCGQKAVESLKKLLKYIERTEHRGRVELDFSAVNQMNYYSGIIYNGIIEGCPKRILSGGEYDGLLRVMKKKSGAIGFAIYLDYVESSYRTDVSKEKITLNVGDESDLLEKINEGKKLRLDGYEVDFLRN